MASRENDLLIAKLIADGRVKVDLQKGIVTAPRSNTPTKALGAVNRKGYLRTSINLNGKAITLLVHRIVYIAAFGLPADSNLHVNHKNGNKLDNCPVNLELLTHRDNMAHSRSLGLHKGAGRKDCIRDTKGRFGKAKYNEFPEAA